VVGDGGRRAGLAPEGNRPSVAIIERAVKVGHERKPDVKKIKKGDAPANRKTRFALRRRVGPYKKVDTAASAKPDADAHVRLN